MYELSLAHRSFGGKCGLTGTKSRQTRQAATWLAKQFTRSPDWLEKFITGNSKAIFSEFILSALADFLEAIQIIFYYCREIFQKILSTIKLEIYCIYFIILYQITHISSSDVQNI